jgi:hypothetical protein
MRSVLDVGRRMYGEAERRRNHPRR